MQQLHHKTVLRSVSLLPSCNSDTLAYKHTLFILTEDKATLLLPKKLQYSHFVL